MKESIEISDYHNSLLYQPDMRWITVHEACKILRIYKLTLYDWGKKKYVKMRRVSPFGIRLFDYDEITALAKVLPRKRAPSIKVFRKKSKRSA